MPTITNDLKQALELGAACGLRTVQECVDNCIIHSINLYAYTEFADTLARLDKAFEVYKTTGGCSTDSIPADIVKQQEEELYKFIEEDMAKSTTDLSQTQSITF